jgi:hypothetical protein
MVAASTPPSPQLLEANRRLHQLRGELQKQRATELPLVEEELEPASASATEAVDSATCYDTLPFHLGWGSEALTAVLRRRQETKKSKVYNDDWLAAKATVASNSSTSESTRVKPPGGPQRKNWVKLYPDIGLGMLREEMTAPGRLWLLLRYLDGEGRGALRIETITEQLTQKTSPLRLCGKRQLRNLLQDGEGVFWVRDEETIWLRSAAKAAHALGVERLTGRPVALPVEALLNGIGNFRAHLYTAFHSGRTKETPRGSDAMPISRSTLTELSGVGASSQRAYEAQADVEIQENFAVGERATKENHENRAWTQGQAVFELKDYRGRQGKKGQTYLAWQLPNSYIGAHPHRPKGRQKRINRELKDLVMKGMPGNVEGTSETRKPEKGFARKLKKVFFPNGKLAARAYGRNPDQELYWRRHRTRNGRFELWQRLGNGRC